MFSNLGLLFFFLCQGFTSLRHLFQMKRKRKIQKEREFHSTTIFPNVMGEGIQPKLQDKADAPPRWAILLLTFSFYFRKTHFKGIFYGLFNTVILERTTAFVLTRYVILDKQFLGSWIQSPAPHVSSWNSTKGTPWTVEQYFVHSFYIPPSPWEVQNKL